MAPVIRNKQLYAVARLAEQQNWNVELTGGGHLKWTSPTGEPVFTSSTPSDDGGVRKAIADLEKRGLVCNKAELKRLEKDRADLKSTDVIDLDLSQEELDEAAASLAYVLMNGDKATRDDLYQMGRGIHQLTIEAIALDMDPNQPGPPCEGCGAHFVSPIGAIAHRKKCDDYQRWLTTKHATELESMHAAVVAILVRIGPAICLGLAGLAPVLTSTVPNVDTGSIDPQPDPTEQETTVALSPTLSPPCEDNPDEVLDARVDALLGKLLDGHDVRFTVANLRAINRWTEATKALMEVLGV